MSSRLLLVHIQYFTVFTSRRTYCTFYCTVLLFPYCTSLTVPYYSYCTDSTLLTIVYVLVSAMVWQHTRILFIGCDNLFSLVQPFVSFHLKFILVPTVVWIWPLTALDFDWLLSVELFWIFQSVSIIIFRLCWLRIHWMKGENPKRS